ncbi:MAG: RNA 3'-phosphate cyclase [Myxococcales bacterium]|nr:RNA 3'-phosphate cyclase [Myxococcales bacterium]
MADGELIVLDGSEGEGGGQILRSALSLSLVTGLPFRIIHIRANRRPSGLRPQHLACVRGAEAISGGTAEGAKVGASELRFEPGPVKQGNYLLDVGTAGSTTLLLQCLYYPVALGGGGELTLRGGTHVPHSPSYHYLSRIWLPALARYGLGGQLSIRYAGFYPEGAGEIRATVPTPMKPPEAVDISSRGTLAEVDVISMVANLPLEIAERQASAAVAALRERGIHADPQNLPLPTMRSTGTAVLIRAAFERSVAGFSALGEKRKRAEEVGREAAALLARFMESGGAVDEHLADQLLLPAALLAAGRLGPRAGATRYTPPAATEHLRTNAAIIRRFLPVRIELSPEGKVLVAPAGATVPAG